MGFADLLQRADAAVHRHLGDTCVYSPGSGAPLTVTCVFDASYVLADPRNPGVSSTSPAVFVRELPGMRSDVDARVTYAGTVYSVRDPKPDGLGGIHLLLHEA